MQFQELEIPGILLIQPKIFEDERGCFFESFKKSVFEEAGIKDDFQQDNHSTSVKNVIRGLHFQLPPFEQGKLVRVVRGLAIDVAVDIRHKSPYYGKYVKVELSASNKKMLWIPPGFAHGFESKDDDTVFLYKCTKPYNNKSESGIKWNDPDIGIDWETSQPIISAKDEELNSLKDYKNNF